MPDRGVPSILLGRRPPATDGWPCYSESRTWRSC